MRSDDANTSMVWLQRLRPVGFERPEDDSTLAGEVATLLEDESSHGSRRAPLDLVEHRALRVG